MATTHFFEIEASIEVHDINKYTAYTAKQSLTKYNLAVGKEKSVKKCTWLANLYTTINLAFFYQITSQLF